MSTEGVARIDDRMMSAWAAHDVEGVLEMLADDFAWTDLTVREPMRTKEEARRYVQGWFTAFPDMQVKQTNRVLGEDSVGAELEFTGTNTGPLEMAGNQIPATGKGIVARGAYFARIDGDKVVEFSSHPDAAGLMMQLGLMPG
jgi:steroid delta-isomerase-like uncharacterized protein